MSNEVRRYVRLFAFAWSCIAVFGSPCSAADAVEWTAELNYLRLPDGWTFGPCSATAVNRRGEIFVFHRGEHPILVFDAEGKFLRSWGDDLIGKAHGLRIAPDQTVWTTDMERHRVYQFSPDGKLLLSLGTGRAGDGPDEFNRPTDVAFGPNGERYVSDGYGNARVQVFSPSGALAHSWGRAGRGEGEFRLPHSAVVDRQGRVLIGDRENNRIQAFDRDGKFLAAWPGFAPYGMALDADGLLFVADARANQILQLDDVGRVVGRFGREGTGPGEFRLPHMLAFAADGSLFVAEVDGRRVQRLVRKK